jgi:hypothetical protein
MNKCLASHPTSKTEVNAVPARVGVNAIVGLVVEAEVGVDQGDAQDLGREADR